LSRLVAQLSPEARRAIQLGTAARYIPAVREAIRQFEEAEKKRIRDEKLERMGLMEHPVLGIIERKP
jgi:hypothetical protein